MRPYYIMVSLPSGRPFADIYRKSIKPIESATQKIKLVTFLDHPTIREFSNQIRNWIQYSNAVICILSGNNHNVLYEVGLSIGFGKPILPLVDSVRDIPAMLKHRTAVTYGNGRMNYIQLHREILERLRILIHGEPHMVVDDRHVTHIKQLIEKQPPVRAKSVKSGGGSTLSRNEDFVAQGLAYHLDKKYPEAIKLLAEAMKGRTKHSPEVYFSLADACFMYAEALAAADRPARAYFMQMLDFAKEGSKAYPEHKELEKSVGLAYMNLRQFDKAQALFERMLKKYPKYPNALYNLACIAGLRDDPFTALRYLDEVFSLKPEWRFIARTDKDLDGLWKNELFQRILYPAGSLW